MKFLSLAALIFSTSLLAMQPMEVIEVRENSDVIVGSINLSQLQEGDILKVSKDCSLEVYKLNRMNTKAITSTEYCKDLKAVELGKVVTVERPIGKIIPRTTDTNLSSAVASYKPTPQNMMIEGLTLGIHKPFGSLKTEAEGILFGETYTTTEEANTNFGFGIGYNSIPKAGWGYETELIFQTFSSDEDSIGGTAKAMNLAGNLTTSMSASSYFYFGFNINHFTSEMGDMLHPGVGLQMGFAWYINSKVLLNLGFKSHNNNIDSNHSGYVGDIGYSGIGMGVRATL